VAIGKSVGEARSGSQMC